MSITVMSLEDTRRTAADALGVGLAGFALASPEGIAASVRRASSFLCPATQRQIADAVLDAVAPVVAPAAVTREQVSSVIEALVLNGDLVEATADEGQRLLFLAPPSFVERTSNSCLVIGIRPFGERLLRADESLSLEYHRHTRVCRSDGSLVKVALREQGLREISARKWVAVPDTTDPKSILKEALARRRSAGVEIPGLTIIDRSRPVTYYRGRWRDPQSSDNGVFVGRRPQEYGAPLWCCVRLEGGHPSEMVDLPVLDVAQPGCDEAWRLQAALDALDGHPQVFRFRPAGDGTNVLLGCFSPVPSWAEKYLALKGDTWAKSDGALFTYRLDQSVVKDVREMLVEKLWMHPVEGDED